MMNQRRRRRKPMATAAVIITRYIPEEILYKILLMLPAKSLINCTAVCKSWNSLIKSSAFIGIHLRHQYEDRRLLLLLNRYTKTINSPKLVLYNLYHWDNQGAEPHRAEYNSIAELPQPPILHRNNKLILVETCNGLICHAPALWVVNSAETAIIIWNPSARKYVILPPSPNYDLPHERQYHDFVYDSRTNDCMVLRSLFVGAKILSVEVYTLAAGSWKSLSAAAANHLPFYWLFKTGFWKKVLVNRVLHAVARPSDSTSFHEYYLIVTFDFSTQLFGQMSMPPALSRCITRDQLGDVELLRYKESLALIKMETIEVAPNNNPVYRFHVWAMKEYGVEESWTEVFDTTISLDPGHDLWTLECALDFKSDDELVLEMWSKCGRGLTNITVNLKTREVKHSGIYGQSSLHVFVESLVLLDHPDAISY